MFVREKKSGDRAYLQLVVNRRVEGKVRQHVLFTLGRKDQLLDSGEFESLHRSMGRQLSDVVVLSPRSPVEPRAECRRIGLQLVFERLWEESGCRKVIRECAQGGRHRVDRERLVFFSVLHRLRVSGSDRSAEVWGRTRPIDGLPEARLHNLYRAMKWLGTQLDPPAEEPEESLGHPQGDGRPHPEEPPEESLGEPSGEGGENTGEEAGKGPTDLPRCVKDQIEERLFVERHGASPDLDLVFFDTTTLSFYGEGGPTIGKREHSKDRRADDPQMVLGMALAPDGMPVCTEICPGNTADVTTLLPLRKRLQQHFGIGKSCLVADRGMISKGTMAELESEGWEYILGMRLRNMGSELDELLADPAPYQVVRVERAHDPKPLELHVKEVTLAGEGRSPIRHIVCRNPDQMERDKAVREAQLANLREKIRTSPKSLIRNKGFSRLLEIGDGRPRISESLVKREALLDGLWVLRTNTSLDAETVARKYKELWRVEHASRTAKAVFSTAPVYHQSDEAIRGHVFCSFLAFLMQCELLRRMARDGVKAEWDVVLNDLDELVDINVEQDDKRLMLHGVPSDTCAKVIACVGAQLPDTVRPPKEGVSAA